MFVNQNFPKKCYLCILVLINTMKSYIKRQNLALIIFMVFAIALSSCHKDDAEKVAIASNVVGERADSALILLRDVDFASLNQEYRARYILTKAEANIRSYKTLVTDSLLPEAVTFYKAKGPMIDYIKSSRLYASYLLSRKAPEEAVSVLDKAISSVPRDSVDLQYELRGTRLKINASQGEFEEAIKEADWLIYHTNFDSAKFRYSYLKMFLLWSAGRSLEAIAWGDTIRSSSYVPSVNTTEGADFLGDYAEILDESGKSAEALRILEDVLEQNPGFSPDQKVGFLVSLAKFNANIGNINKAKRYLAAVDSLNFNPRNIDNDFRNYLTFLNGAIKFKETGHISGTPNKYLVDELRHERLINRDAIKEMNSLSAQKMKAEIERQRLWLGVLASIAALLLVTFAAYWIIRRRQRKLHEAEERIDTLNEMLMQVRKTHADDKTTVIKRLALQQMGILKTFAAAPSTQNRDVLKKISGIGQEAGTPERLVDWNSLYSMIDELYDEFHSKVLKTYPNLFTEKELQIISLMRADFSTKEIGVLTEQSSATVYVRKSAIRKKLGTSEGGDFMAQLEERVTAI